MLKKNLLILHLLISFISIKNFSLALSDINEKEKNKVISKTDKRIYKSLTNEYDSFFYFSTDEIIFKTLKNLNFKDLSIFKINFFLENFIENLNISSIKEIKNILNNIKNLILNNNLNLIELKKIIENELIKNENLKFDIDEFDKRGYDLSSKKLSVVLKTVFWLLNSKEINNLFINLNNNPNDKETKGNLIFLMMRPIIEFHEKNTFDKVGLYKIINDKLNLENDLEKNGFNNEIKQNYHNYETAYEAINQRKNLIKLLSENEEEYLEIKKLLKEANNEYLKIKKLFSEFTKFEAINLPTILLLKQSSKFSYLSSLSFSLSSLALIGTKLSDFIKRKDIINNDLYELNDLNFNNKYGITLIGNCYSNLKSIFNFSKILNKYGINIPIKNIIEEKIPSKIIAYSFSTSASNIPNPIDRQNFLENKINSFILFGGNIFGIYLNSILFYSFYKDTKSKINEINLFNNYFKSLEKINNISKKVSLIIKNLFIKNNLNYDLIINTKNFNFDKKIKNIYGINKIINLFTSYSLLKKYEKGGLKENIFTMVRSDEYINADFIFIENISAALAKIRILNSYENNERKYSIINLASIDEAKEKGGIFEVENLWYPNIENATLQSFNLKDKNRNMMLVAPYNGGKSTSLATMICAYHLSYTGIASADYIKLTPPRLIINKMESSYEIGDSSSGHTEEKRDVYSLTNLLNLKNLYDIFAIDISLFDEIYKGTHPKNAVEEAQEDLEESIENKYNVFFITTHFPELTNMTKNILNNMKLFYLQVDILSNNIFKRRFKINADDKNNWWLKDEYSDIRKIYNKYINNLILKTKNN